MAAQSSGPDEHPTRSGTSLPVRPVRRGFDRGRLALVIALAADVLQWVLFPFLLGGALAPVNNVLDVAVAIAMLVLVGWHWAFLPTFIAEMIPLVELVPSWTLAVWLATRGRGRALEEGEPPAG